ncbi:hypothetical protein BpHYR1_024449 [Brachionus plicatilis]|uniref:Uncharacterized protein n=1 Tax=Brachionus plicatilis TaxID=10195 RepID=A0A3M7SBL8_BRAPC|nr:hypothetical protein BpHYR1_024449 [Brachionus plicatilis]
MRLDMLHGLETKRNGSSVAAASLRRWSQKMVKNVFIHKSLVINFNFDTLIDLKAIIISILKNICCITDEIFSVDKKISF